MGDTLKREFQPGQVITGGFPDPNQAIDAATFGGQVQQPQTRPTFLSAFLQNIGPALAGGAGQSSFSAGVGGALQGIEEKKRYQVQQQQVQQQNQFSKQQQERLNRSQESLSALQAAQAQKALQTPTDTNINEFDLWRQQNPNAPISEWFKLKTANTTTPTTPHNTITTDKGIFQYNPATNAYDIPVGKPPASTAGPDARMDRSYQFTTTQLGTVRKPIDDRAERIGRLVDSLNQNSPQADALIAPELLTAMAGGQGSGLRMNEAEINRIVGGRNNWQNLLSAALKWQKDPSKPFLITPDQRQQVRDLVGVIQQKVEAKQTVLDAAQQQLINSKSIEEHRKILADARTQLTAIDKKDFSLPDGEGKTLDEATAQKFLKAAGGNADEARIMAGQHGWKF